MGLSIGEIVVILAVGTWAFGGCLFFHRVFQHVEHNGAPMVAVPGKGFTECVLSPDFYVP